MTEVAQGVYFIQGQDEMIPDSHVYLLGMPFSEDLTLVDAGLVGKGTYKLQSITTPTSTTSAACRGWCGWASGAPIYCTPPTRALAEILLLDAAHLQQEDAGYFNRKGLTKHEPALPLFDDGGRGGGAGALPPGPARPQHRR